MPVLSEHREWRGRFTVGDRVPRRNLVVKMNPHWWPNNPGSVLVIPIDHYENVFDLPPSLGTPIQAAVRSAGPAMKVAYGCDGVSTRQHNEPAGDQDVWHYHVHVFPRWANDSLYLTTRGTANESELRRRAGLLRNAWPTIDP